MSGTKHPATFGELQPSRYPGERLGLPEHGNRSVARAGRRFGALFLDWGIASIIAYFLGFGWGNWQTHVIFAILQIVFIPTIGGGIGHRLLGMRVVPISGGYVGLWRPVVRTVLLCLILPALVWDSDQRGFHDKIAGTVLIRYRRS